MANVRKGFLKDPTQVATLHPTTKDICWAAGIFEGEGHFGKNHRVLVGQKDPWILYRLRDLFGGRVFSRIGGMKHDTHYVWQAYGARGRGFVMTIYGLLSPRKQATIRERLAAGVCYR